MIEVNIKKIFYCDKDTLWDVITNNHDYAWRSDLSKIEITDETHFVEYDKNQYPTKFTITKKEKLNIYELEIENTNLKGKWSGSFKVRENGSMEINFTEAVAPDHFIMKLLAKPYLKRMQKRYISDLKRELRKRDGMKA